MSAAVANPTPFAQRTLADIAATLPGATQVFRRGKLDFCCGGDVSLADAAAAKNLSLSGLEAELAAVAATALPGGRPEATGDLIAMIETRYHAVHRRELPELIKLARRVEAVHRDHPAVPAGLASLLERIAADLEDHMRKEELVLFPLMRQGRHPAIEQPIAAMLAEHDGDGLRELERMADDFTPPSGACTTWRALYAGLAKFTGDLMDHIHTENAILFPRFAGPRVPRR